jgi:hypothetical protein
VHSVHGVSPGKLAFPLAHVWQYGPERGGVVVAIAIVCPGACCKCLAG